MTNALFLLHVALLGGLLAGWAPHGSSKLQLGLALGFKAAFARKSWRVRCGASAGGWCHRFTNQATLLTTAAPHAV